jgi:hypothetical protein
MKLTQVLSPGSEWMSSFFEEDEDEDVPEMPVAEMPVLWDRQEWQDNYDDEEVQPPVRPDEQGDPDMPPIWEHYDSLSDDDDADEDEVGPPITECRDHFEVFRASQESNSKPTVSFSDILTQVEEEKEEEDPKPAAAPVNSKPGVCVFVPKPATAPGQNTEDLCEADCMTIAPKKKEEQLKGVNNKVLEAEYTTSKHAQKKEKTYKPGWESFQRRRNHYPILQKWFRTPTLWGHTARSLNRCCILWKYCAGPVLLASATYSTCLCVRWFSSGDIQTRRVLRLTPTKLKSPPRFRHQSALNLHD